MVHGRIARRSPTGDGTALALAASLALALGSAAFLLAVPQVVQLLQISAVSGLAPL